MPKNFKMRLSYAQWIALGFFLIIFTGAFLLTLPISSRSGAWTSFTDALFTASSATCVTGLIVFDTFTYWSLFGQIVIISLIQIGGLGVMTVITLFSILFRKQISLHNRRLLVQTAGSLTLSGIIQLVKKIAIGTFLLESIGAAVLAVRFSFDMSVPDAIFSGIFHSISAFCNAGFDLMGRFKKFSSLTLYVSDPTVNITIMSLIVLGGIGFIVWNDFLTNKFNFRAYSLHSKIVLTATFFLIFGGGLWFYIIEQNHALLGLDLKGKIFGSLFLSITPRTCGFVTTDCAAMSEGGALLTMLLMLIGGSPGSTAGGIKTTTFVILLFSVFAAAKGSQSVSIFKRKIDDSSLKQATSIFIMYVSLIFLATMFICAMHPDFSLKAVLFEVFSAMNTVGNSMGITSSLNTASKLIISFLMYCGRIGALTFALVIAEKKENIPIERPVGKY